MHMQLQSKRGQNNNTIYLEPLLDRLIIMTKQQAARSIAVLYCLLVPSLVVTCGR